MTSRIVLAILICAAGGVGCAATDRQTRFYEQEPIAWVGPEGPRGSIVFNGPPETPPPHWFAYRSDWPSARRDVSEGEIINYEVFFVDRERARGGHGFSFTANDQTYRVFRSVRSGRAYR